MNQVDDVKAVIEKSHKYNVESIKLYEQQTILSRNRNDSASCANIIERTVKIPGIAKCFGNIATEIVQVEFA